MQYRFFLKEDFKKDSIDETLLSNMSRSKQSTKKPKKSHKGNGGKESMVRCSKKERNM